MLVRSGVGASSVFTYALGIVVAISEPLALGQEAEPSACWGTVVLIDEHGVEHVEPNGRIEFCIENGYDATVPVVAGRWRLELTRLDVMYIGEVELDGRRARARKTSKKPWRERGEIDLRAEVPRPSIVHVVDADTGAELRDVGVWTSDMHGEWGVIGNGAWLEGDSPFDVAIPDVPCEAYYAFSRELDVMTDGYEWARVPDRWQKGGEFVVPLERGAIVTAYLPPDAGDEYEVFLVDTHGSRRAPSSRPARFQVQAGSYGLDVLAEGERVYRRVLHLGLRERVVDRIVPSELGMLPGPQSTPTTEVARQLVLRIPNAWRFHPSEVGVSIARFDPVSRRFGDPVPCKGHTDVRGREASPWKIPLGVLGEGTYQVRVEPVGWTGLVRFAGRFIQAELDLPPPVELDVRAVVIRTWEPVEGARLRWRPALPSSCPATLHESDEIVLTTSPSSELVSAAGEQVRIRVPQGLVEVYVEAPGFRASTEVFEVSAGQRELVVGLIPARRGYGH